MIVAALDYFVEYRINGTLSNRERIVDIPRQGKHYLWRQELNTGKRTALLGLTRLVNRSPIGMRDFDVSPNGQWVLWTARSNNGLHWTVRIAAAIDGSRQATWHAAVEGPFNDVPCYVAWLSDSRHIAEVVRGRDAHYNPRLALTVHDIDSSKCSRMEFPVPVYPDYRCQVAVRQGNLLMATNSVYAPGRLPLFEYDMVTPILHPLARPSPRPTNVDLCVWSLAKPGQSPRELHLSAPQGCWVVGLAFSPAGDRIAWEVVHTRTSTPLQALLSRLLRHPEPASQEYVEVWTSNLDGGVMREIGYIPLKDPWDDYAKLWLQWLPGGHGLQFTYNDALYTVPVD